MSLRSFIRVLSVGLAAALVPQLAVSGAVPAAAAGLPDDPAAVVPAAAPAAVVPDRLVGDSAGTAYRSDVDGLMTGQGDLTLAYNGFAELVASTSGGKSTGFVHDGLGRVAAQTTDGTTAGLTYHGQGTSLAGYSPGNGTPVDVLSGLDGALLGYVSGSGVSQQVFTNSHGDVERVLTGRTTSSRARFDGFGRARNASGTPLVPLGFQAAIAGAAACGALAGAAGSMAETAVHAYQDGKQATLADLGGAALAGAVGGAIGGAGGAILGKAITAVGAKLAGPITKLLGRTTQEGEEAIAGTAGKAATEGAEGRGGASCPFGQSFAPETRVLLATGKTIPIAALKAGDKVRTADTKTGKNHKRAVIAIMVNHDTDLFDVTVRRHGTTASLHTTSGHPFWTTTRHTWVRADQLTTTDRLTTTTGDTITVDHTQATPGAADRWDLTVDVDHDFYVLAGHTPVLVHNCGTGMARTYQTYTKTNAETGEIYSGRTSGTGSPLENVARRDAGHHMNDAGFGPAALDQSSSDAAAIRGREQMLIDATGGAKSMGGTSGNAINGISPLNPRLPFYLRAAVREFG